MKDNKWDAAKCRSIELSMGLLFGILTILAVIA